MGNTPSGSANEGGRSRPPVPATPATPAAPAAWDGPPVFAEAVPVEATPAAPPLSPAALSPSATAAPPLAHIVAGLRLELGLSGSHVQVVDQAVAELGLPRSCGSGLVERARACWNLLHGEEADAPPPPPPRSTPGSARAARGARSPPAPRERLPTQYDLSVGDLVVAATAWKRVAVGDRGVVVGPCEDAAEKAPHKRCRVRFDDGKGTYVYTKGQQARRAPLAGQHVLGDGVLARAAVRGKCAAGDRGVVVGRGRRGGLTVKWAPSGATCDVAAADVAPAPVVAAPGAPRILKGDVVVASVDYETVKVGDRGVVVGPCSDPAMSRADLRVLVDFDGKAAYNYRCDTQIQLAPLLDGATFVRDDTVVARGRARGVVVGLGADGRTLRVATDDGVEDVTPADLAHAPLVADAPQFRKGARVVARVGYNAVRAGDRGVVVGPCNVLTMPNASKRVLVDFGTGKGLYNYAAGTQLDVAADDAPGVFPSLNGA